MKKLLLKSNTQDNNISLYYQDTIRPDSNKAKNDKKELFPKDNNDKRLKLNNSFLHNKNNNTIDCSKIYSPSIFKPLIELPKIQNNKKTINVMNNTKLNNIKHIMISNSSANIHSQNLFGLQNTNKKVLKRDRTQITLIKEEEDNDNTILNDKINSNNKNINLKQNLIYNNNFRNNDEISLFKRKIKNSNNINNITNINIHIYSKENQTDNDISQRSTPNSIVNKFNNITSRDSSKKLIPRHNKVYNYNNNIMETISTINNSNSSKKQNNIKNIEFPRNNNFNINIQNHKKLLQKQSRMGHSSSVDGNKNTTLAVAGNIIMNNSKINLFPVNNRSISKENNNIYINKLSNNLPEINLTQNDNNNKKFLQENQNSIVANRNKTLSEVLEEYEEMNINDIEKINNSKSFLIDINKDKNNFILFLKLFQIHLDMEILLNSLNINVNNNNIKNELNSPLRQKMQLYINNDKQYKFYSLLNNYFNILNEIYTNKYLLQLKSNQKNNKSDLCFFNFSIINKIFKNCLKCQICLFASILISTTQLALFDFNLILKNYFYKLFTEISFSLVNIFESFIKEELQNTYNDIVSDNLRNDFFDNYKQIKKEHKNRFNKKSDIIKIIITNIEKSINSLKFYSSSNLKYSLIKPYGDSLNQLLFSFDRKTLYQFVDIFLNTILYGELESNKKIVFQKNIDKNNNCGSSLINNIKESPPYLPPINPNYKYTLVLDVDETLIHFFFTYINGMFFVRPYCIEFLNDINKYYEIVTFTAGTKEYADNILNLLDINDNLIKYRLYRQHTTIMGCNVFKDLTKLGRDLNKLIIIDNLKDNFKLQPNNGLFIKTWTSDVNDNQFYDLGRILKDIVLLDVKNVRPVIEKINDDIKISRNIINPYSNIDIKKILLSLKSIK